MIPRTASVHVGIDFRASETDVLPSVGVLTLVENAGVDIW